MAQEAAGKRSYFAMLLSLILPGFGQLYLRRPLKGFILFLGVALAGLIIYFNSYPVANWQDLTRLDDVKEWRQERRIDSTNVEQETNIFNAMQEQKEEPGYQLWIFKSGRKLMYRPSWKLKVSGFIQGFIFWLYAIYDGWRGQKGFNKRAFRKRLREAQKQQKAEEAKKTDASTGTA